MCNHCMLNMQFSSDSKDTQQMPASDDVLGCRVCHLAGLNAPLASGPMVFDAAFRSSTLGAKSKPEKKSQDRTC